MLTIRICMSVLVVISSMLNLACTGGGSGSPIEPNTTATQAGNINRNMLYYNGNARQLTHGIVDVINSNRGHLEVDFAMSDSAYQIGFYNLSGIVYSYWFAPSDTVSFSADLYSASVSALLPGTYEYVDITAIRGGDSTIGQSVFSQAHVGWDFNGDGNVDSDEELDIVEGSVVVTSPNTSMTDLTALVITWDVLLVNGVRSTGQYQGGFTLVE